MSHLARYSSPPCSPPEVGAWVSHRARYSSLKSAHGASTSFSTRWGWDKATSTASVAPVCWPKMDVRSTPKAFRKSTTVLDRSSALSPCGGGSDVPWPNLSMAMTRYFRCQDVDHLKELVGGEKGEVQKQQGWTVSRRSIMDLAHRKVRVSLLYRAAASWHVRGAFIRFKLRQQ